MNGAATERGGDEGGAASASKGKPDRAEMSDFIDSAGESIELISTSIMETSVAAGLEGRNGLACI